MPPKRVTSSDVAKHAGVSRTTVSLVLNDVPGVNISDKTRQRVLEAAKELGYVPDAAAQALASRQSKTIGLVLTRDSNHIASDAYLSQILDSLVSTTNKYGMHLILDIVADKHNRETYLNLVQSKGIDGIIFSGPRFDDDALQELAKDGFPTVLMGQLPGTSFCTVDVDNVKAAKMAVDHLINLGHKRIGCITNASLRYTAAIDRLEGYKSALEDADLEFSPDLVRYGDFNLESGYFQMRSILQAGNIPTAMFVASDVLAFGAMAAIRENGLSIPQDIALVGFDNVPMARYVEPYLTTVHLPAAETARCACELLFSIIRKEEIQNRQILLDTKLVIRESCGAQYTDQ